MDLEPSTPTQTYSPPKVDDDDPPPVVRSQEQVNEDSSGDDIPLRQRRPVRASAHNQESGHSLHDRHRLQDYMREVNDTSLLDQRRTVHQGTQRKPANATPTSSGNTPKKPGPRPWATKPIKKNDMNAKKKVIREIEKYWGKGFIKTYIPKCHRPLMKRQKGGKHVVYRSHETDPKNWLPSVLKSILSIAKLTQNQAWLKKAMNDVVRYRIKNTGNRKPQLVTTDFDVLEDMLVKDWDVPFSFSIRYKHLLVNRQGQQETDEDIDHILGVGTAEGEESDEGDVVEDGNTREEDDNIDGEDGSDEEMDQDGLSGRHIHASGHTSAPQYPQAYSMSGLPPQKQKAQQERNPRGASELPSRPQPPLHGTESQYGYDYPHPYGPSMDFWGRSTPFGGGPDGFSGYSGYGGYGMYGGGYGSHVPPDRSGRQPSQPPRYYGMSPYAYPARAQPDTNRIGRAPSQRPASDDTKHSRSDLEQPPFPVSPPGFQPHGYAQHYPGGQHGFNPESVDREIHGEAREASVDDGEVLTDHMGDDSNAAALEAELRATELELKVARLQARRAAMNRQSGVK
ncbi:hypothetical protein OPT61_g3566 [Boeremia exigua]|uniref:Uncharacterized protein n=1 Tax=Boeremia exigua TaxID=749465 RepID=A0ACC2IHF4_9PLEO|nr:hypothetical protein OPT61_g3566 [Boeremia exigua]